MSDKDSSASNAGSFELKLTPGDSKFFVILVKYLPKAVEIDWDEFAKEMGLKDGNVAKVRFRQIRTKLGILLPEAGSPAKPATPKVLKPANENNKVTKSRKSPAKVKKSKQEPEQADEKKADVDAADAADGEA
ncbi:hypothetical protein GGS24DRAFT_509852 [Hypoxylon argillaceum]|nr:hypothetical protein GGS24DRAFT_509852 [Hypoxylon argillaceum]KAI1153492.1 hypothetical protein F4825DRAFT_251124 [Nemania diffusa]